VVRNAPVFSVRACGPSAVVPALCRTSHPCDVSARYSRFRCRRTLLSSAQ